MYCVVSSSGRGPVRYGVAVPGKYSVRTIVTFRSNSTYGAGRV